MNKAAKKWILSALTMLLSFACFVFGVACGEKVELTLSQTQLSMVVYDEFELTYELTNSEETVVWNSSDDAVVSVDNGKLTAKKEGVATITATAGEVSATCSVTVAKSDYVPTLYVGESTEINLLKDGTYTFAPRVEYKAQTVTATFAYASSATAVAEVTANGKVTAKSYGEAVITITANFKGTEIVKTVKVNVKPVVSGEVTVADEVLTEEFTMYTTDVMTLNVKTFADGTVDETIEVEWTKTDADGVVTLAQSGKDVQITANKAGTVTVKVTYSKMGATGESEYTLNVMKKVFALADALFIDKGAAVEGNVTVVLPTSVTAADVQKVSVAGETTDVTSTNATENSVTFAIADVKSGEISLGFETELFCYSFENTVVADMVIKTKDDFTAFGNQMIAKTTADKYYVLGADIDYQNGKWAAGWPDAAGQGSTFAGIFDGRGYTISNVNTRAGIFTTTINQSVIKNTIFAVSIVGSSMGAAVVKTNNGTVENCAIVTKITAGEQVVQFAGLVHTNGKTGTVKNCAIIIESYNKYDTYKEVNAICYTNNGAIENCYAVAMSEYINMMYGEVSDGLYKTAAAFFAEVTALENENGWNEYWSIADGKLYFGTKQVL